jgi:hypothetical protein
MTTPTLREAQDLPALLPCPHCGAEAGEYAIERHAHAIAIGDWKMPDHPGSHVIECGCGAGMIDNTRAAVVARWNRRAALAAQPAPEAGHFSPVTVLPDGSAFATASFPLPADHWLTAPRGEWDSERDEYSECPPPILTRAHCEAVKAAVRYAVRGATNCGRDADFDPDALVLNAIYALCGPATSATVAQPAPAVAQQGAALTVLDEQQLRGQVESYGPQSEDEEVGFRDGWRSCERFHGITATLAPTTDTGEQR